jgi:hypothetical protein
LAFFCLLLFFPEFSIFISLQIFGIPGFGLLQHLLFFITAIKNLKVYKKLSIFYHPK